MYLVLCPTFVFVQLVADKAALRPGLALGPATRLLRCFQLSTDRPKFSCSPFSLLYIVYIYTSFFSRATRRATFWKQLCDACILAQSFINLVSKSPSQPQPQPQSRRRRRQQHQQLSRDKSTIGIPSQDQQKVPRLRSASPLPLSLSPAPRLVSESFRAALS